MRNAMPELEEGLAERDRIGAQLSRKKVGEPVNTMIGKVGRLVKAMIGKESGAHDLQDGKKKEKQEDDKTDEDKEEEEVRPPIDLNANPELATVSHNSHKGIWVCGGYLEPLNTKDDEEFARFLEFGEAHRVFRAVKRRREDTHGKRCRRASVP